MTLLSLNLGSVAPEIILAFVACVVLLADLYLKGNLKLDELVSNTAGLDGLQGAFDALKSGAEARTVLLPHG